MAEQTEFQSAAPFPEPGAEQFVGSVHSNDFESKVLQSKGKVVVDFSAIWCGPCHALAPVLEAVAKEHADEVTIYSCNIDECRDLSGRYSVYSVPTLILFEDGEFSRMTIGAQPKSSIEAFIGL